MTGAFTALSGVGWNLAEGSVAIFILPMI
jgi:hypothetical protein